MLFSRHKRQGRNHAGRHKGGLPGGPGLYPIEFDMMLRGSIYKRSSGEVRQFGVTVNGSTRLVTSGDVVDQQTYDALIAAGAVRPLPGENEEAPSDEEAPSILGLTLPKESETDKGMG